MHFDAFSKTHDDISCKVSTGVFPSSIENKLPLIYFIVTILKHKYVVLQMEMYSVDSKNVVIYIYTTYGCLGGSKTECILTS